jgi:hypothetical protein
MLLYTYKSNYLISNWWSAVLANSITLMVMADAGTLRHNANVQPRQRTPPDSPNTLALFKKSSGCNATVVIKVETIALVMGE